MEWCTKRKWRRFFRERKGGRGRKEKGGKKDLHWPRLELGSPAWQASILPLDHQCSCFLHLLLHLLKITTTKHHAHTCTHTYRTYTHTCTHICRTYTCTHMHTYTHIHAGHTYKWMKMKRRIKFPLIIYSFVCCSLFCTCRPHHYTLSMNRNKCK